MTAPATPRVAGQHRHTLVAFWLAAGILILLTWWHVLVLVNESHAREYATAERDLANLTRLSQEHATRTLRSVDQVIQFVRSRYLDVGERLDLAALASNGIIDAEIFNQVGIINAQGLYILGSLPAPGPIDLSDRAHFKVHVAADTGALFISQPVIGRLSGKWSIQLSRRITRPNGEFAGVVVVSIDPAYFSRFYAELKLGPEGVIALYGLDGVARARKVGAKETFGTQAGAAPMFGLIAQGQLFGFYTHDSVVDGIERLYFYRKIPDYPLVVVAGLDAQELSVTHRYDRDALRLQASLVSLLILALACALHRHLWHIRQEMIANQSAQCLVQDRTKQLNAIFALSPDGFVSFDPDHRVEYISPAFIKLMVPGVVRLRGLTEHEFSTWLAQRCLSVPPFSGVANLRSQITQDKPDVRELIEINNNGKRVLQVGLRCSGSGIVSQILYFRDVTAETEVNQMKSEFLSTAAHELRTPMASILGFAEVLLTQELDAPTQHEFLTIIHEQSKLMANILDELLNLARIEARRSKDFLYTRVCLQELMTDIVRAFSRPPGRSLAELEMPEPALYVMADIGKLQQAILNVLSNAYKYSPAGGPVRIQVEVKADAGQPQQVCIHITDQGIGMTPAQLHRVCERFYRADSSGKIPGTGLGMSIVKEIIELHHGDLTLVSTVGQGTRVSLCLPV